MTTPRVDRQDTESCARLGCDLGVVADFLDRWAEAAEPRHLLTSILPDTKHPQAKTFNWPADSGIALPWIERSNRNSGIYWTVNVCRPNLMKKAQKHDVQLLRAVWADCDPLDDPKLGERCRPWAAERQRLYELAGELEQLACPPSVILDSGNGIQVIYRLADPIEANEEYIAAIETLGRRVECCLGGIENTNNCDRILRLPGTVNWPNKKKRDRGRIPAPTGVIYSSDRTYAWVELEQLAANLEDDPPKHAVPIEYRARGYINGDAVHLDGLPDYPTEEQIESLLENHPNVRLIWDQTTLYPPEDTSPSGWDQSFASTLAALGFPPERVASYLRAYRAHHSPEKGKQDRADYIWRTVQRAQPADAHLGEAPESDGEHDECPPDDGPPHEAGQRTGSSSSNGAGQHQTAGDAQGRNRGTFKTGSARPNAPGWPEPGELGRLDPAPEFPTRFLHHYHRAWIECEAEVMGVPVDFLAIASLVAIAGCIGKDATLRPDRCNIRWTERPAFWGGIIAQKGTIKSSSIIIATNPLRAAEAQYRDRWKEQVILWQEREDARQASKKGGKKRGADDGPGTGPPDDPRPPEPHMVTDDCTIEALGEAMVTSRGMTWISDELSGWVDNMSRYSKGNDRQFYLKCHSGGEHMIGRIKRGWQLVPDCYLNVIGGIQPAVAKSAFSLSAKAVDDGFFERFGLLAFPDLPEWNRNRQPSPATDYYREYREACIRLAKCHWNEPALLGGQPMTFCGEAQERFDEWLDHHMSTRVLARGASERGDHGFLAKGKGLVPRLAIVLHLYRWTSGDPSAEPGTVDLQSLNSAIGIFAIYCVPTYARILQAFGQVKGHAGASRIAAHIKAKKLSLIRIGDISKMRWEGLRERADIIQAFEVLEDLDWITPPEKPKSGLKGGRPSEAWHVNPRVHVS